MTAKSKVVTYCLRTAWWLFTVRLLFAFVLKYLTFINTDGKGTAFTCLKNLKKE
ncbi:hypothetical protein [Joostella sp. CR20]|uniref:hypothetical protein n=1 Tax=Joostella sp. CR20 TaxID=2804312 RepID=UPI00313D384E